MLDFLSLHKPGKFFWALSICFWFTILSVITYIQYNAILDTSNALSWGRVWVLLSPWFLNWIWVSGLTHTATNIIEESFDHWVKRLGAHLVSGSFILMLYFIASTFMRGALVDRSFTDNMEALYVVLTGSAHIDVLIYGGVVVLTMSLRYYQQSVNDRIELKRLQTALIEEQLKTLRTQLNPHFLFNALNTIASLVRLKQENDAVRALSSLSVMLRTILDNKSNKSVRVKDEIKFIESYLAIQKMRFEDKLDVDIEVDDECLGLEIPNMLLHPLIENAVQHGAQSNEKRNPLRLKVAKIQDMLQIDLLNAVNENDDHKGYGIGVSNTRERLARMFDNFHFELTPSSNGMFQTRLIIPTGDMDA
ncbi:histidine kinase [Alteromonas sp. KUL49]|uniref:sensor histidine kinase n=1 Tax=Alteromonas sp. KUL49 TaxID=2480798 RepID=UPI00102F1CE4|nr:histidine kinase [Alteromonas sp. KUL49]TAP40832.1 hypothetical protein EYS00_06895 [Alteromonas sp. KUL49]GEA11010.1 hypothetical protein KUL49_13850 [Alteromonas sp. KUL49]